MVPDLGLAKIKNETCGSLNNRGGRWCLSKLISLPVSAGVISTSPTLGGNGAMTPFAAASGFSRVKCERPKKRPRSGTLWTTKQAASLPRKTDIAEPKRRLGREPWIIGVFTGLDPAMDYQREYEEYWSRADRWGSHSFEDPEQIADHILGICGNGKILDVGFGMGLLVRTLLKRGVDVHGMDVARRVVEEAEQFAPGRFKVGSILEMPYSDAAFSTVISTDCLEHIAEADVPKALAELYRVTHTPRVDPTGDDAGPGQALAFDHPRPGVVETTFSRPGFASIPGFKPCCRTSFWKRRPADHAHLRKNSWCGAREISTGSIEGGARFAHGHAARKWTAVRRAYRALYAGAAVSAEGRLGAGCGLWPGIWQRHAGPKREFRGVVGIDSARSPLIMAEAIFPHICRMLNSGKVMFVSWAILPMVRWGWWCPLKPSSI